MKHHNSFKFISIGVISAWLVVFALAAFGLVVAASFMTYNEAHLVSFHFTTANYKALVDPLYLKIFLKSFFVAGLCTLLCLVIGYPFAYVLARIENRYKNFLLLLVMIPFWTSSLIRSYAMMSLLKAKGLLNGVLISLGIIHHPLQLLFTNAAVIIGLVYNLLPFMILPLYANLERFDVRLLEAAKDLGASTTRVFIKVVLPLSLPGIVAGCVLVLLPAMTLFYIPDLLGGAKSILLGNLIEMKFLSTHNWPLGSAVSVVLTVITTFLAVIYYRYNRAQVQQDRL